MNSLLVLVNENYLEALQSSPAATLLAKRNTPSSMRTQRSILYRLVEILDPPGLTQVIAGLESRGLHRHEVVHLFPWHQLTYSDVVRIRAKLASQYVPSKANSMLCDLRAIIRECWLAGLMTLDNYERASSVKAIFTQKQSTSSIVSDSELKTLFDVFRARGPIGLRDASMLTLMCLGMSPGEVCLLDVADYDAVAGIIHVKAMNQMMHGRQRSVYLNSNVQSLIESWLQFRGNQSGPLFTHMVLNQHMIGKITEGLPRLSAHGIYCIFILHEEKAGLKHHRLMDYRKTFITKMFDHHIDSLTISKLAGVRSADYLKIYDGSSDEEKKQAANQVFQSRIL